MYGAESWKMTKTISHKLEVFQNRCLHRILNIFWPNTISNAELHRRTTTKLITQEVQMHRWIWIRHVLQMPPTKLPRVALRWTPDGHRKRGRPKETWRRTVERERDEGTGVDLGIPGKMCGRQSSGGGLMRKPARRDDKIWHNFTL